MSEGKLYGHERLHKARRDAADELYEALEIIANGCPDVSNTAIIVGDGADTVMRQVRAALSKARGETPR